jgi:hypothetical protein
MIIYSNNRGRINLAGDPRPMLVEGGGGYICGDCYEAPILIFISSWIYKTEEELESRSHWGQLTTYKGGGFTQLLAPTKDESAAIIEDLKVGKTSLLATAIQS